MNTEFRKSFERDLEEIVDRDLLARIQATVEAVEAALTPNDIPNLKKMKGKGGYYRIRVGDYRIGLKLENATFIFVRILARKEIYRYFP